MTHAQWTEMKQSISSCPDATRYRLQPRLEELIARMKAKGEPVPAEARQLNNELIEEAIEAQFDNVPV